MRRLPERLDDAVVFLALFVTMTLCGLWHGAAWTFVVFGVFHGLLLCLHRASREWLPRLRPGARWAFPWSLLKGLVTFHLVCLSFVIFRAEDLPQAIGLIQGLSGILDAGVAPAWIPPLLALTLPLVAIQVAEWRARDPEVVLRWPAPARTLLYFVLMVAIVVQGEDGGQPFIYFQF